MQSADPVNWSRQTTEHSHQLKIKDKVYARAAVISDLDQPLGMKHPLPQPSSNVRYFKYTGTASSLFLLFVILNTAYETSESYSHADSPQILIGYKTQYQIYKRWEVPPYQAGLPLFGKVCNIYSLSHLLYKAGIERQSAFLDIFMMMREILQVIEARW